MVFGIYKAYFSLFAFIFAGDNQDVIILFYFHRLSPYNTSGARDRILVNNLSLNSLATGPKIRVPLGLFFSVRITAALSSNLMYVPSARRCGLIVLMTTARTTSPAFTEPPGTAFLTLPTMTSPTWAYLRPLPPRIFTHITCRAPVLSATFNLVYISITSSYPKIYSFFSSSGLTSVATAAASFTTSTAVCFVSVNTEGVAISSGLTSIAAALMIISSTRHLFSLDMGRVSTIFTVSPI